MVVQQFFKAVGIRQADTFHFFWCRRGFCELLDTVDQGLPYRLDRLAFLDHRGNDFQARCITAHLIVEHGGRFAGFHQRFMQAAVGSVCQNRSGVGQGIAVRMQFAWNLVGYSNDLHVALAPYGHAAFAVLGRFHGPEIAHLAAGFRQFAEGLVDPGQGLGRVEFTGDQQHRVVWLIVGFIKGLQVFYLDVFDIAAVADGRLAVVMPIVCHSLQALDQNAERRIFALFVFVAHHGHFAIEVFPGDKRMQHAIGFHVDRPFQVVIAGLEDFIVIGAVDVGGAVERHAALAEILGNRRMGRGALEHQVFQQMRHACFAVILETRSDQVSHVDGYRRLGRIGKQQDFEAVGKLVFGDAFSGRTLGHTGRKGSCCFSDADKAYAAGGSQQARQKAIGPRAFTE